VRARSVYLRSASDELVDPRRERLWSASSVSRQVLEIRWHTTVESCTVLGCTVMDWTVMGRDSLHERRWQTRARAGHEAGDAGEAALTMQPRAQDDENLVGIYLQEIGRYALLTRNDEVRLYEVIAEGRRAERDLAGSDPDITDVERRALHGAVLRGKDAQQSFVQCNLRLVVSIARRYRRSGRALPDLIQDGNLGLIHAVTKFDARKGFKFSTYATLWIRQSIVRGIESTGRTIRLPAHVGNILRTATRAQEELGEELGRPPTMAELGVAVGLATDKLAEVLRSPVAPLSLDEPLGARGDATASDLVEDRAASAAFELVSTSLPPAEIARLLERLGERERRVLRLRFGLDGGGPRTLVELGACLGLSRERVRQIEARAMCMLRHPSVGATTHDLLVDHDTC